RDRDVTGVQTCALPISSKSVLRYFPDAAILHVGAEQNSQHSADLRLPFAAIALDDHHSLALIAGNQTVADVFLQGGNVLRVEKEIGRASCRARREVAEC